MGETEDDAVGTGERERRGGGVNLRALEKAFVDLRHAMGESEAGDAQETANRAADLWFKRLLAGQALELEGVLGQGMPSPVQSPVVLTGVQIHMVCPHHLTVAFGTADLGFLPAGRLVGLGHLAALVEAATARLVLQEDAGSNIVDAVVKALGARAAVVRLRAMHPCLGLTHANARQAELVTWSQAGDDGAAELLMQRLASPDAGVRC